MKLKYNCQELLIFVLTQLTFLFNAINCGNLFVIPSPGQANKVVASIEDSFMLSCVSSGTNEEKPKGLQWRSPNNEVIKPDPNNRVYTVLNGDTLRLYFDKLVPSDSGTYTCIGIEAGVPQEVKADLVLQKKINFYETPVEQFIKGGFDQTIICRASANPGPEIAWFRKGINVELKNDHKYQMTNDGLMVKNAQPEDEGQYICQASVTSTGEVKRVEINVQVMSPPKWVIEPKDTEGVRGEDVVIKCYAFAKPVPVYSWMRNGIPLAGPRYTITDGTLTIRNLEKEDTGTYSCVAENNSGKIEGNLKLFVLIGPEIALIEDVRVIEGSPATLKCIVREAYPKALIKWKYADTQEYIDDTLNNNFQITADTNNEVTQGGWSELTIKRTSRFDKRNYTCVATNKAAISERQGQLMVEYRPKLILNTEAREVYYSWLFTDDYGSSGNTASQISRSYPVVMTCLADAEPKALITWYYKGILIKLDNIKYRMIKEEKGMSKIEINPRSIEDFGDYQCRAENVHGKEELNIQLRKATPPKFPPLVKVKAINPENVIFDIFPSDAPDADGGMPIEGYKIQWRLVNADWSKPNEKEIPLDLTNIDQLTTIAREFLDAEITTLLPDTEYLFRAAAINKAGIGVYQQKELKLKTAPRRQPDPVRVTSTEDCHASTRCYIEWMADSNGGSPIREYIIKWRRITYKDPSFEHVDTDKIENWSQAVVLKAPKSNYEIIQLTPNSFYEIDVVARNDIGPSASQPFRIRTLAASQGVSEEYERQNQLRINRAIIIAGSVIGACIMFLMIDVICLIKSNCGLLAIITRSCNKDKSKSNDYKSKSPAPKIAQFQPNGSQATYQPIKQTEDMPKSATAFNDV